MIGPQHAVFQPRTDDVHWNESSACIFFVPERELTCWIHLWHRPNMNCSASHISVWDTSAREKRDILFYEYWEYNRLGRDMFDFELESGLRFKLLEPLKAMELSLDADGCSFDLRYDAVTPAYEYRDTSGDDGISKEMQSVGADGHYSQGGRYHGTMTVAGETFDVDCRSFHDRSWGPRKPGGPIKRGGFANCYTPDSSFDLWSVSTLDPETDPVHGTTEMVATGMYLRDGELSLVSGGEQRITERTADGDPLRVELQATDKLGRKVEIAGECVNWYHWHGVQKIVSIDSLMRWEFDGQQAYGYFEDFRTQRQNRRVQMALRGAAALGAE